MFRENKALAKTSKFTVPSVSLTNRKTCRISRMNPTFQGSVACKRRFEFHPVAKWPRGYKRFFACGALAASICVGIVIPSSWSLR